MESNRKKHPEAWAFFESEARNMEDEISPTKYRIPEPTKTGEFIYADDIQELWRLFIVHWYKVDFNSQSIYGKMQYIVQNV